MRKFLRMVAVISGVICFLCTSILAFIYFEDLAKYVKKVRQYMNEMESQDTDIQEIEE